MLTPPQLERAVQIEALQLYAEHLDQDLKLLGSRERNAREEWLLGETLETRDMVERILARRGRSPRPSFMEQYWHKGAPGYLDENGDPAEV